MASMCRVFAGILVVHMLLHIPVTEHVEYTQPLTIGVVTMLIKLLFQTLWSQEMLIRYIYFVTVVLIQHGTQGEIMEGRRKRKESRRVGREEGRSKRGNWDSQIDKVQFILAIFSASGFEKWEDVMCPEMKWHLVLCSLIFCFCFTCCWQMLFIVLNKSVLPCLLESQTDKTFPWWNNAIILSSFDFLPWWFPAACSR